MSLVACRACHHEVDTSALACPKCGATDPGKKISRQQRNLISFVIQCLAALLLIWWASIFIRNTVIPAARELIQKPTVSQTNLPTAEETSS